MASGSVVPPLEAQVAPRASAPLARPHVHVEVLDDLRVYLPETAVNDSDAKELHADDSFGRSLDGRSSRRLLFDHLAFKANFIRTFDKIKGAIDILPRHTVLELGASYGWASVIVKDDCPQAYVVTSDLVAACVRQCKRYEEMLGRNVDEKWVFSVREIPFADAQFDRVFTFAAFHHFSDHGDYARALTEISRILKPGGKLVLLYEPTSPAFLYHLAHRRVNRKRANEARDEDVLVHRKMTALADRLGMTVRWMPFPSFQYRDSVAASVYYYVLAKLHLWPFGEHREHCVREILNTKQRET